MGAVGVLAGFGLGMLALAYRNEFLHFMNRLTGFELFPASIYGFSELPALIVPRDIVLDLRQRVGDLRAGRSDPGLAGRPAETRGGPAL